MLKNKFYIFFSLVIFVVAAVSFAYFTDFIKPEGNILGNISTDIPQKNVLPGDDEKIIASLNGEKIEGITVFPEISHDKVKLLLKDVSLRESFCWYFKSTLYSSKKSVTEHGTVKFDSGNYRIELFDAAMSLKKTIIQENDVVFVRTDTESSEFSAMFTNVFNEAGVPGVSDFVSSGEQDYVFTLIESDYGTLLFAEFINSKNEYSIKEQYYISLDFGIVVRADCYENERLVYSLETTALYELDNT